MNTDKLREAITRKIYECWEETFQRPLSWGELSETRQAGWLSSDETNALLALFKVEIKPLRDCLGRIATEYCLGRPQEEHCACPSCDARRTLVKAEAEE